MSEPRNPRTPTAARTTGARRHRTATLLLTLLAVGGVSLASADALAHRGDRDAGRLTTAAGDAPDLATRGDPPPGTPTSEPPPVAPPTSRPEIPTTTAPPADDTDAPVPPATPAVDPVLRPGASGPDVEALEQRLVALGFWLGAADRTYDALTQQAVMAFQKVNGLHRDGLAGPATLAALADAARPVSRSGSGTLVEIDLTRQVLFVVEDGRVVWTINTSTGTRATPTPPGRFVVDREIDGVRRAPLGDLYRPKYFNAGIAVHGSPSIPGHPASHGCARVHDAAMDFLWASGALTIGTPVVVHA